MKSAGWVIVALYLALAGCGSSDSAVSTAVGTDGTQAGKPGGSATSASVRHCDIETMAAETLSALRDRNYAALAGLVHPDEGLRLSPYANVNPATDKHFSASALSAAGADTSVYTWGQYDGSGEPIEMTIAAYFDRFVYDRDFASANRGAIDTRIGSGNSIDNIGQAYADGHFVEYYVPGDDPDYDGLDWASLRLVFEEHAGCPRLVGIVHDQWTI